MIILIGGTKGGTGKSTIATNIATLLANQGQDVMLLDTDKQASSAKWHARRASLPDLAVIHCTQKSGDVRSTAIDLASRYDVVIVDAGGHDSLELRSAMGAADVMYVPFQASQFDLETLENLSELIDLAKGFNPKLKVYVLISCAPSNPAINEIAEAKELLASIDQIQVCESVIRDRKVYRDAIRDGRGVYEANNDVATKEMIGFAEEIFNVNK